MYRLITKKDREEMRKLIIGNRTSEKYKDIEIVSYNENNRFYLTIFKGTAGRPYINYYYTSEDARDNALFNAKKSADRREANKKAQKDKPKTLSTAAQTAQTIRKILKREYPEVKFKVKSENYSMGNSVRVYWTDGIDEPTIADFVNQFQYGHFDGMQDLYEYSNKKDFPQVKYAFANRTISDDMYKQAFDYMKETFIPFENIQDLDEYSKELCGTARNYIWRYLNKMDLRKGFNKETFKKIWLNK